MKNNYLSKLNKERKKYTPRESYFQNDSPDSEFNRYILLPEEYNIFSEINQSLFINGNTKQDKLIAMCLKTMRENLLFLYSTQGIICILPKLTYYEDQEKTITFNWANSNFRAFLSFESEVGGYDAYCGIIIQFTQDDVSTQTSKLNENNYQKVIGSMMKLIIENS